jgi:hypothetical protein
MSLRPPALFAVAFLVLVSCSAHAPVRAVDAAPSVTPLPTPPADTGQRSVDASLSPMPTAADPVISQDGVGPLRVGKALPARFRHSDLLNAGYIATYYSDAQPLEGFKFDDPPVTVYVEGAFHKWGQTHIDPKGAPADIRAKTVEAALAGRLCIKKIAVESLGPKTDRGIGIGASRDDFRRAYPSLNIEQYPALWDEPTLLAQDRRLAFFFSSTQERPNREEARILLHSKQVIRIVVYENDPTAEHTPGCPSKL